MKIGIITLHASENFGSILQAFALQSYLNSKGHDAYIIDYTYTNDYKQYNLFYIAPGYFVKSLAKDILYFDRKRKRKKVFLDFSNSKLKKTNKSYYDNDDLSELNKEFDAFICGSDQIWNPNCLKAIVPAFFLDFADDNKRKIAYAPSMPIDPGEKYYDQIKRLVNRLDYVSVREDISVNILKERIGIRQDVINVCDPTLLLPGKFYIDLFDLHKQETSALRNDYIFVYILGDIGTSQNLIKEAINIQNKTHMPIYYVSNRKIREFVHNKNKYLLGIGPSEFLKFIYNSNAILTDSFHATVFSILFEKRFISFGRNESESRVKNLLSESGLMDHYGSDYSSECLTKNIPYKTILRKIHLMRENGERYLEKTLFS